MRVTQLSLTDFRSYEQVDVTFAPGVTSLVGRNGQGKTNVVEAVRYLSTLSSHRVAGDAPLVRHGAAAATVRGNVEKDGRSLSLEITINPGKANTARINRGAAKPRDIAGILRTVVFAPEDLALVKGDPATRRGFMDEVTVALQPTLAGDIADYDRVVRQRSTLLKTARGKPADLSTLDVWDDKLAALGARIVRSRAATVAQLAPHVASAYADIAPDSRECVIAYDSGTFDGDRVPATVAEIEEQMRELIAIARPKELERGVCLVGPHRDELAIALGDLPAKGYASHGESWSCALALRLGTYDLLTSEGSPDADPDGEPVLILDDVFAELDSQRRDALAARAAAADQVLVTAAVAEDVPAALAGAVLYVADGAITTEAP